MQEFHDSREGSQGEQQDIATFKLFPLLANELQHRIWEESFPRWRIFDDDTLRLLNPQDDIIYSYLTSYALYVCHASREFTQRRFRRSFLFRSWPKGKIGRVIYFQPEYDVRVYQMSQLHWRQDGHCLFSCVKIVADVAPEDFTGNIGFGLRSMEFCEKFPNLKEVIVTNRHLNLHRNFTTQMDWRAMATNKRVSERLGPRLEGCGEAFPRKRHSNSVVFRAAWDGYGQEKIHYNLPYVSRWGIRQHTSQN